MKKALAEKILKQTKENYNQIAKDFSNTRKYLWKSLNPLLYYITKNDKVLDLGCGNGRLFELIKHTDYVGVDNSEALIKIARRHHREAKFKVADGFCLPFDDNSFDKVISIAVLHHVPSKELRRCFLKEAKRVLKKDGLLILTAWKLERKRNFKLNLKYTLLKIIGKNKMDFKDVLIPWNNHQERYVHLFSKKSLKKIVENSGFSVKENGLLKKQTSQNNNIFVIATKTLL